MTRGLTLDSGALIAIDRGDRRVWTFLKLSVRDKIVPVVPSPVIVEVWRNGRQAQLARALRICRIEPLDETLARRAGELCGVASTRDPVDASS